MKPGAIKGSLIFTTTILVFVLTITLVSLTYKWQGRIVPLLVGTATSGLIVLLLTSEVFPGFLKRFSAGWFGSPMAKQQEDKPPSERAQRNGRRFLAVCGWLIAYTGLVFLVGAYIGSTLFSLAFVKVKAKTGWLITVGFAVAISAGLYLFFELLLKLELFRGALFGAYVPPI